MASLSGRGLTTDQIKSLYARRIEVFMEGKDDFAVYTNYWFCHLADRLEFRLSEDGPAKHGGCVGVEKNVAIQRSAGVVAYGIIDRDALDDVAISCITDDGDFVRVNHARNPHLYFTLRWELENYLVDPEIWEAVRVDLLHRGHGHRKVDEVIDELLGHCEALIPHAAVNAYRRTKGLSELKDGACRVPADRRAVQEFLDSNVLAGLGEQEREEYQVWIQRIEAFDDPNASPHERLSKLGRRIHGKALLDRFNYKHKLQVDIRFAVARALSERIPAELKAKIIGWVVT